MKAIIIQDTDARALLNSLELTALNDANFLRRADENLTRKEMVNQIHRAFHFVVTRWLQEQGADVVGR